MGPTNFSLTFLCHVFGVPFDLASADPKARKPFVLPGANMIPSSKLFVHLALQGLNL